MEHSITLPQSMPIRKRNNHARRTPPLGFFHSPSEILFHPFRPGHFKEAGFFISREKQQKVDGLLWDYHRSYNQSLFIPFIEREEKAKLRGRDKESSIMIQERMAPTKTPTRPRRRRGVSFLFQTKRRKKPKNKRTERKCHIANFPLLLMVFGRYRSWFYQQFRS